MTVLAAVRRPADPVALSPRTRRLLLPLVIVALLGLMAAAMMVSALQQTPTIDEPGTWALP